MKSLFACLCLLLSFAGLSQADERVVLQLKWEHEFQFAGYYAALWQGYYREAGLDVEIRAGFTASGDYVDVRQALLNGDADFGIAGPDVLVARDRGDPLVILASVFQHSPVAFYALETTPLQSPADLTHLPVMVPDDLGRVEMEAILRAEGVDPVDVELVGPFRPGLQPLLQDETLVTTYYRMSAEWEAAERGVDLRSLSGADYGIHFYGDTLISHQALVERDPELVERFRAASLKGWRYALEHPREIADRISRELPRRFTYRQMRAYNRFTAEIVRELMEYPEVAVGNTSLLRWRKIHDDLHRSGIVEGPFDSDIIFDIQQEKTAGKQVYRNLFFVFGLGALLLGFALMRSPRYFWLFMGGLVAVVGFWGAEQWYRIGYAQDQRLDLLNRLSTVRARLEGGLLKDIQLARGMIANIANNPDITPGEFERLARGLMDQTEHSLVNMAAAPDLIIRYMYPLEGNEAAVGLDYRKIPQQREAALRAVESGDMVLAGPVKMVQGGEAFIGRAPVFVPDEAEADGRGRLWGLVSIPIDAEKLYRSAGLYDPALGFEIAIRGRDALGEKGEVFFGDPMLFERQAVMLDVSLPGGGWQLAAAPSQGWENPPHIWRLRGAGLLLLLSVGLLAGLRIRQQAREKRAQQALKLNESLLRQAETVAHMGSWEFNVKTGRARWSPQTYRLLGVRDDQPRTPERLLQQVHPEDRARLQAHLQGALAGENQYDIEYRVLGSDGRVRHLHSKAILYRDEANRPQRLLGVVQDVTERRQSEQQLRKLYQAVDQNHNGVVILNVEGQLEYANPAFVALSRRPMADLLGGDLVELLPAVAAIGDLEKRLSDLGKGTLLQQELNLVNAAGEQTWHDVSFSPIRDGHGRVSHILVTFEDISLRKDQEQQLLIQAQYDNLTGLPNRRLVLDRLAHGLKQARRAQSSLALLFIDLDGFKHVNDTFGHEVGDRLLQQAAGYLQACARESDTVGRLGGDEFVIIAEADSDSARLLAERINAQFQQPIVLDATDLTITASIGIAVSPDDGDDPNLLMRNADAAMYLAKEAGRNTYRFYTRSLNERSKRRMQLLSRLRKALEKDELCLVYQPLCRLSDGAVTEVEALVRWQDNELGMIGPDEFIPLAEESGLIEEIGDWILRTAVRECLAWQKIAEAPVRVAINVSPRQIRGREFADRVLARLAEAGLSPSLLVMEVTEGVLMEQADETEAILTTLRDAGVSISMDDFGTGYSSLSYLKRFPVDCVKIDRSFVRDLVSDADDALLVSAIISMTHGLGLSVVGEGVENEAQLQRLRGFGCDLVQGYFISRPLPAGQLRGFLQAQCSRDAGGIPA